MRGQNNTAQLQSSEPRLYSSPYTSTEVEVLKNCSPDQLDTRLEEFLVFGSSPETLGISGVSQKSNYLTKTTTNLLEYIIQQHTVREPQALRNLVTLLAFQIGQEVAVSLLASRLGVDSKTASRYLDLLEKSYVIIRLDGFGRSLASEITRKSRYYFLDNGIRNAVLSQFNKLALRNDAEQLWENFVVVERFKKQTRHSAPVDSYFWHTYSGQELELVEEGEGELHGYGFKLSHHKTPRLPKAWFRAYPAAHYHVVNLNNYLEFIS